VLRHQIYKADAVQIATRDGLSLRGIAFSASARVPGNASELEAVLATSASPGEAWEAARGPEPARVHSRGFGAVPGRVRWFIYLLSFAAVGYGYLLVVVSAYLPEIGLSSSEVGVILGTSGAALVVSGIPLGALADRIGKKRVLLGGLLTLPPSLLVYAVTTEFTALVVAGVVAGVAEGAYLSTWNAMIADQTTVEVRDSAFSLSFILGNASIGAGFVLPLGFPALEAWTGLDSHTVHTGAFVVVALFALASPISIWFLLRGHVEERHPKGIRGSYKGMRILLKFSAVNAIIGLGAGFIIPLVPTWLFLKFGVPDTYSGPLLALSSVTIGLAAVTSPGLSRRFGSVRAIVMTQGLSTVFMFSLAFVPGSVLAGVVYLVRAALMNMASPLVDAFLMGIVPKEQRALASAINSLFWRLPNSASTIVGGVLLASGNYELPFFLATGFYVVSISLFFMIFRKVKPST